MSRLPPMPDHPTADCWTDAESSCIRAYARAAVQAAQPEAVGEAICERCNGSGETAVLSGGGPDAYDVAINCPACKGSGVSCAMTDAAGEAFNNTFHKVRAEVSMDWWQRIWAKAVEWERSRASAPTPEPMSAPTEAKPAQQDAVDAERWRAVRKHWKNAKFTYRKDAANLLKTITLLIDFDHETGRGATVIERDFDAAISAKKGQP